MYLEKRKYGKKIKFYLVYSYRENGQAKKIRRYLGQNLSEAGLKAAKEKAGQELKSLLADLSTEVFFFTLTKTQIRKLNRYNEQIKITHLSRKSWQKFTEEFTYSTNAIEGSTVQRDEVVIILEKKQLSHPDESETKGVAKAVAFIKETKEELSIELIKKLHWLCFEGSKEFAGKIRTVEVVIKNALGEVLHRGVPASQLSLALRDLISWHDKNKRKFKPLVLAAIIHNQFEYIHPFQDGNGRVGRLLLNFILLKNGYPPINIALEDRAGYYLALQAYQNHGKLKPMVEFLIKQYKKTLVTTTGLKK